MECYYRMALSTSDDKQEYFNGGSLAILIVMSWEDFMRPLQNYASTIKKMLQTDQGLSLILFDILDADTQGAC